MNRNYMSLNINERINLKSHHTLPLAYYWKNNMVKGDLDKILRIEIHASPYEQLNTPHIDRQRTGMATNPVFVELYRCLCCYGCTFDPNKKK